MIALNAFYQNSLFTWVLLMVISFNIIGQGHPSPPESSSKQMGSVVCYPATTIQKAEEAGGFIIVEKMPMFPACNEWPGSHEEKYQRSQQKLLEYFYRNCHYPVEAREAGIQGHVEIQYVIETDGFVSNVKCTKDIGYGCGEEAMRVIRSTNALRVPWSPAERLGKPIRVKQSISIRFTLD